MHINPAHQSMKSASDIFAVRRHACRYLPCLRTLLNCLKCIISRTAIILNETARIMSVRRDIRKDGHGYNPETQ